MVLVVGERCLTTTNKGTEYYALRTYHYESEKKTLLEAHKDFEENFNIDNVFNANDEFDGDCLDSEVIKVEIEYE